MEGGRRYVPKKNYAGLWRVSFEVQFSLGRCINEFNFLVRLHVTCSKEATALEPLAPAKLSDNPVSIKLTTLVWHGIALNMLILQIRC